MEPERITIKLRENLYHLASYDIGDRCTHCGRDTSFGSGNLLFVNRIPSETDAVLVLSGCDEDIEFNINVEGYMCPECQEPSDNLGDE